MNESARAAETSTEGNIFDLAPSPLWREDWTEVHGRLERLRADGIRDFGRHFAGHPRLVTELAASVSVVDVNQAALELYGAASKTDLLGSLGHRTIVTGDAETVFRQELIELAAGRTKITSRLATRSLDGRAIEVLASLRFFPAPGGRLMALVSVVDITERERAAQAYRTLVESSLLGLAILQGGRFVLANRTFAGLCGYDVDELLALPAEQAHEIPHPEDRAWLGLQARAREAGEPMPEEFQLRLLRRDGTLRWIQASATRVEHDGRPAVQVSVVDITERKQAEDALQVTQFAVDHAAEPIYWVRRDGRIVYANEAACRSLGYTRDELTSMSVPDIDPDFPRDVWAEHWQEMKAMGSVTFEAHHRARDGRIMPVEITTSFLECQSQEFIWAHVRDITERKRAEKAYRTLVNHSLQGLTIMQGGRVVLANQTFAEICGYTVEELLALTSEQLDDLIHPDDRQAVNQRARAREAGQSVEPRYQLRIRRRDGTVRCLEAAGTLIDFGGRPASQVSAVDITERKRAEQALRFTQFAVDHAGDAAYWMRADGTFFYVNEAASRMLGYPREILDTMSVFDISDGLDPSAWAGRWEEVKRRRSYAFESRHRRQDGTWVPVEIGVNYLDVDGHEYNCAFARDISERKRVEAERRRFDQKLQATQKLESLGVLAGGIAHDFNNLLTGILGNASLVRRNLPPGSSDGESLQEIERAALRAADLTSQMLAYAGKGRFVVERVDLSSLIEHMAGLLAVTASKGITLQYDLDGHLPPVEADEAQMRQTVMNLVVNAIEALSDAAGQVVVRTGVIDAGSGQLAGAILDDDEPPAGRYVFVEVTDTGAGMDQATRARIFEPFFTTKFAGRGLGLAAVRGIVRGHRGTLKVASEPGRGTTVTMLLPAAGQPVGGSS